MNSNTFQDPPGQTQSYKFGSLSHTDAATRQQAIEHNLECIEIGQALGSKALTVWIADGSNFPGQSQLHHARSSAIWNRAEAIYADAARRLAALHRAQDVRAGLLFDRGAGLGHQLPDRHASSGDKAYCLVDLGHHAPNVNIEMIVARLIQFGKLGGFHFNDSQIWRRRSRRRRDRSVPPVPRLQRAGGCRAARRAGLRAGAHDRPVAQRDRPDREPDALGHGDRSAPMPRRCWSTARRWQAQERNDALMATRDAEAAFRTDVEPILAMARLEDGGAIDPVAAYRASGSGAKVAAERPARRSAAAAAVGLGLSQTLCSSETVQESFRVYFKSPFFSSAFRSSIGRTAYSMPVDGERQNRLEHQQDARSSSRSPAPGKRRAPIGSTTPRSDQGRSP